jgi:hypothetical protein
MTIKKYTTLKKYLKTLENNGIWPQKSRAGNKKKD